MPFSVPSAVRRTVAFTAALPLALACVSCGLVGRTVQGRLDLGGGALVEASATVGLRVGDLTVTADAAHPLDGLDPALAVVVDPVSVTTPGQVRDGRVTFTYPAGAVTDPTALSVIAWAPAWRAWVPVGGAVDPARRTVSVQATSFSALALAQVDTTALTHRAARALADRSWATTGSAPLLTGGQDLAWCVAGGAGVPAPARLLRASSAVTGAPCTRFDLDAQAYRLAWANRYDLPYRVTLPAGFTARGTAVTDPLLAATLTHLGAGATVASTTGLDLSYPAEAVAAGTRVTLTPDALPLALHIYSRTAATLLGGAGRFDDPTFMAGVDQALVDAGAVTCVAAALDGTTTRTAPQLQAALTTALDACTTALAPALTARVAAVAGVASPDDARAATGTSLTTAFAQALDAPVAARRQLQALLVGDRRTHRSHLSPADPRRLDLTLVPGRYLTAAEARTLPLTDPAEARAAAARGVLTCGAVATVGRRTAFGVPGDADCATVVEADLDADGSADRVVTWFTTTGPVPVGGTYRAATVVDFGVSAYLADGTVVAVPDTPGLYRRITSANTSRRPDLTVRPGGVHPSGVVHLRDDATQQVLLLTSAGAGRTVQIAVALDDDRLDLVRTIDGRVVELATGGPTRTTATRTATGTAGYGCAVAGTEPHLVSYTGSRGRAGRSVTWSASVLQVEGTVAEQRLLTRWRTRGAALAAPATLALADCTTADATTRGPSLAWPLP